MVVASRLKSFLLSFLFVTTITILNGCTSTKSGTIPIDVLFSDRDYSQVKLSIDGRFLSYLAPTDGVLNLYISDLKSGKPSRPVTYYKNKGIGRYAWACDNKHILFHYDETGRGNTQVHVVNIETEEVRKLTDLQGVRYELEKVSCNLPDQALVMTNNRNRKHFDALAIQINSGNSKVVYQNNNGYTGLYFDDSYSLRFASKISKGTFHLYHFDKNLKPTSLLNSPIENYVSTKVLSVPKGDQDVYIKDSSNCDIPKLVRLNPDTKKKTTLMEIDRGDLSSVLLEPSSQKIQAVEWNYDKKRWHILDGDIRNDFEYLQSLDSGVMKIPSRTLKDDKWIVSFHNDNASDLYYLYDRTQKKAKKLFRSKSALDEYKLSRMHPVEIETRDGLNMLSYITLPVYSAKSEYDIRPIKPLPLVVKIHGGPNSRDNWGLNREHQFFANRGYAVLSVNYRGSTGFGKKFFNAGMGEWGNKMHLDVIDAAKWAIKNNIAIKDKIAIYGSSYGGYEALVGLTFTPDFFACGVDIMGVSNLITNIKNKPAYWQSSIDLYLNSIGVSNGDKFLKSRSPITYAHRIKKPLLIAHGNNDTTVRRSESDQMVAALRKHNIPVTYITYRNEGHGFTHSKNRISFYKAVEEFFSKHLGCKEEVLQ